MIRTCVTCDELGCMAAQGVNFDMAEETFGDLVAAVRGLGWSVDGGPAQQEMRCRCPEHAMKEAPCAT